MCALQKRHVVAADTISAHVASSITRMPRSAALVATHNERIAAKMDRVVRLHDGVLA